jgi:hypothetical protein
VLQAKAIPEEDVSPKSGFPAGGQSRTNSLRGNEIETKKWDRSTQSLLDNILSVDYRTIDAPEMGRMLLYTSKLLSDFSKVDDGTALQIQLLQLLRQKYEQSRETIVGKILIQKRGLKIAGERQALVIGLIHPDLLDTIASVRERLVAQEILSIIPAVESAILARNKEAIGIIVHRLEIPEKKAGEIFKILSQCVDSGGEFDPSLFTERLMSLNRMDSHLFDMLWLLLKNSTDGKRRKRYLTAVKLAATKLSERKSAIRFLLGDTLHAPFNIVSTDCYAFLISNILLRVRSREQNSPIEHTPLEVIKVKRGIYPDVQRYAAWRMEFDQFALLAKLRALHEKIQQALGKNGSGNALEIAKIALAVEREILHFSALVGGGTARLILCRTLGNHADLSIDLVPSEHISPLLTSIVENLTIAVLGLQRIGRRDDLDSIGRVEETAVRLRRLDTRTVHNNRIRRLLALTESSVKAIRLHSP